MNKLESEMTPTERRIARAAARLSDYLAADPVHHLTDESDAQYYRDKTRDLVEAAQAELYHLRKEIERYIETGDEPENVTARMDDADEAVAAALSHLENVTDEYTAPIEAE